MSSDVQFNEEQLATMGRFMLALANGDSRTKDFVSPHGQTGLFNAPGVRPDIYDLTPNVGTMATQIPMYPSLNQVERFEFVTGVTAQTGSNPDSACGTAPKSGNMKVADIDIRYGKFYKGLPTMDVSESGQYYNRADVNRRVRNPTELTNPFIPRPQGGTPDYNTWLGKAYREFGQGAQLDFAYVDWNGNIANTGVSAQLGFIREYNGLDQFIKNTGWVDVFSGNTVTALNSQVKPYNAMLSATIVRDLTYQIRTLRFQAAMKRTPNYRGVVAIHPTLRDPLIDVWACNYATMACNTDVNAAVRVDAGRITDLRDEFHAGGYIKVDGARIALETDAGISASYNSTTGVWTSDIYYPAVEDGNGNPLLYREFLPYDRQNLSADEIVAMSLGNFRYLNDGMYLMTWGQKNGFCIDWNFTGKFRLIEERPDLSGRIDNVSYVATTEYLDPYPGTTYHRDGGRQVYGATY